MELDSDKRATFAARVHAIMEADGRGAYVPVSLVAKACSTALGELPQPEPVPGAAVRGVIADLEQRAVDYDERAPDSICAEDKAEMLRRLKAELEAALRADGLAAVEIPTREELRLKEIEANWNDTLELLKHADARVADLESQLALSERNAREWEAREAKAQEELGKTREARDYHCDDAAKARGALALAEEARDATQRELEKTRAELEACEITAHNNVERLRFRLTKLDLEFTALREQHEALRAGVEYGCEALERHDGPENKTTTWYAQRFRALLKPAPAEAERKALMCANWGCPNDATADAHCADCGATAQHPPPEPAPAEAEPVQPPPPESAMVEQARQPLSLPQRVQRLENVVGTFLHDWAQGSFTKARAAEVLKVFEARGGG